MDGVFRPNRRAVLGGSLFVTVARRALASPSTPEDDVLNEGAVLRDTAVPVGGNPDGDVSLVEWFDYQCPYCRKLAPDLSKLVAADGKLRMVFKDWPVLGPESMLAARLVLAAKYQDKYIAAHNALIRATGRLTESSIRKRLTGAGIDVDRAVRESETRSDEIKRVIVRNDAQAKAFGFEGTPSFIIGKFRVPGILTMEQFAMAIADARKAAKENAAPKAGDKI